MKHFKNIKSFQDLKKQFRELLKANHPDNGGNTETMKEINIEYDALFPIWKDKAAKADTLTEEEKTETASSTRRSFYTANGWEGSRYNSNLSLKEIAKIVRAYVKEKYPTCKFSVRTSYASMCQELHVSIKEFPAKMYKTGEDLKNEGLTEHYEGIIDWGDHKGEKYEYDSYKDEIQEIIRKLRNNKIFTADTWTDEELLTAYDEAIKISDFYAIRTEYFDSVVTDVEAFVNSYNYSDCDGMTDYFDVNFWFFGCKTDECKQVEKTARIKNRKTSKAETAQPEQTPEPEQIENGYTYTIKAGEDTRDASKLWIVRINETLSREAYKAEAAAMKERGGYYSKFKKGFIFRFDPTEILTGSPAEAEAPEEIAPAEEPTPEPTPEPIPEPTEEAAPGYKSETSGAFTPEEIEKLTNGQQVRHETEYMKSPVITAYFATPYTAETHLLFSIGNAYKETNVRPGEDAKYNGFIHGDKVYTDKESIKQSLFNDIETEILKRIPDEATAAKLNEAAEGYTRERIDAALNYNYRKQAQEHFYKGTSPKLCPYAADREIYGDAELIEYIESPGEIVSRKASEYITDRAMSIYIKFIHVNRINSELEKIRNNPADESHTIKRISESIADQKTVKIELANGEIVKCEAAGVKHIIYSGYINSWEVASSDKHKLRKNKYNSPDDLRPADIKTITHGKKILYAA